MNSQSVLVSAPAPGLYRVVIIPGETWDALPDGKRPGDAVRMPDGDWMRFEVALPLEASKPAPDIPSPRPTLAAPLAAVVCREALDAFERALGIWREATRDNDRRADAIEASGGATQGEHLEALEWVGRAKVAYLDASRHLTDCVLALHGAEDLAGGPLAVRLRGSNGMRLVSLTAYFLEDEGKLETDRNGIECEAIPLDGVIDVPDPDLMD